MYRAILAMAILTLISGCATASRFHSSSRALAKNQESGMAVFGRGIQPVYSTDTVKSSFETPARGPTKAFLADYKSNCETAPSPKVAPGLVPIIAAGAQLIFSQAIEKQNKKLTALQESATASYSAYALLNSADINKYTCAVLARYAEDGSLNALILFGIKVQEGLLLITPQAMYAENTIGNTRQPEAGKAEKITIVGGVSLQGVGKQENGLPIIVSAGQDSKKLGEVELGLEKLSKIDAGISLGPLPVFASDSPIILSMSSTEIGDIGIDIDETIAANKALKEAIGPALAEGVKTYLAPD